MTSKEEYTLNLKEAMVSGGGAVPAGLLDRVPDVFNDDRITTLSTGESKKVYQ
jgi:hypothetical protein